MTYIKSITDYKDRVALFCGGGTSDAVALTQVNIGLHADLQQRRRWLKELEILAGPCVCLIVRGPRAHGATQGVGYPGQAKV